MMASHSRCSAVTSLRSGRSADGASRWQRVRAQEHRNTRGDWRGLWRIWADDPDGVGGKKDMTILFEPPWSDGGSATDPGRFNWRTHLAFANDAARWPERMSVPAPVRAATLARICRGPVRGSGWTHRALPRSRATFAGRLDPAPTDRRYQERTPASNRLRLTGTVPTAACSALAPCSLIPRSVRRAWRRVSPRYRGQVASDRQAQRVGPPLAGGRGNKPELQVGGMGEHPPNRTVSFHASLTCRRSRFWAFFLHALQGMPHVGHGCAGPRLPDTGRIRVVVVRIPVLATVRGPAKGDKP